MYTLVQTLLKHAEINMYLFLVLKPIMCFFWFYFLTLFLLDRCGSGLSGESITEQGHYWVGMDISSHMLGTSITSFSVSVIKHLFVKYNTVESLAYSLGSIYKKFLIPHTTCCERYYMYRYNYMFTYQSVSQFWFFF